MKIQVNRLQLVFALIILNLILFTGVIYVKSLIEKDSIYALGSESPSTLPILAKGNVHVNSKAYIVYDVAGRVIVAGKNENLRFSPASTAKIMTATLALEKYPLDQILTAKDLSRVEGSKMDLAENEKIRVSSLIYGLMLPSGNDAAHVLAANYTGGEGGFVAKMNEKAKELNMQSTRFYDPAGYDDNNYTTALDLARLASYAIKNKTFAKIVSTKNITVTDEDGKIAHKLENLNALLGRDGVTGIKTGYTDEAGGVLVTSVLQNGRVYIIVVLNSPDRFADTKSVIDEALKKIRLFFY